MKLTKTTKVKEYARQLAKCDDDEFGNALIAISAEFMRETKLIAKSRNIQSNDALGAVLNEQNRKWQAMCRELEKITGVPSTPLVDGYKAINIELEPRTAQYFTEVNK